MYTEAYPELSELGSVYAEVSSVTVYGCTESTLQPTAVYFQSALKIANSLHSVLHCRYPEITLNPHSTSMGVNSLVPPVR